MQTRQLGTSDLHITTVGFGAWAIGGGDWAFGWGAQEDADSIAAIHRALDRGVNWIDTAAVYGLGHSEEIVGRALKGRANKPYIFTKCARRWDEARKIYKSIKAASVREECENSLRRLQVDVIDLFQIHWPEPDEQIEEGWEELARLRDEGKVRAIGVSNFNVAQLQRAQRIAPVTSLQPPYSLIRRGVEAEILPFCREQRIGVIAYSPMQSGLLTGAMTAERVAGLPADDWRRNNPEFKEPRLSRNLQLAQLLGAIGARHGASAGEVAIAWVLQNPAVTGAIVGARSPAQVDGTVGAMALELAAEDVAQIEGFVREQP
ncbi:MAG: aldo/keto reductase [Chloroflexales bacterium]|nr:aldo/keto reductase [Chloroflexales bacterium]